MRNLFFVLALLTMPVQSQTFKGDREHYEQANVQIAETLSKNVKSCNKDKLCETKAFAKFRSDVAQAFADFTDYPWDHRAAQELRAQEYKRIESLNAGDKK
jgi:hypothetical protein